MPAKYFRSLVFAVCLIAASATSVCATDFYVDAINGNDTKSGRSWALALKTFQGLHNRRMQLLPGDNVYFAKGDYYGSYTFTLRPTPLVNFYGGYPTGGGDSASRNPDKNVTQVYFDMDPPPVPPTEQITPSQDESIIDGFTFCATLKPNEVQCINAKAVLRNNVFRDFIIIADKTDIILENNKFYLSSCITRNNHASIKNNVLTGMRDRTVIVCDNAAVDIRGNVIRGCAYPLSISSSTVSLVNNSIIDCTRARAKGVALFDNSNGLVTNNLFAYNDGGLCFTSSPNISVRNNCFYSQDSITHVDGIAFDHSNIITVPKITSVEHGDYHIQPDSPCIDAGNDSDADVAGVDIDGGTRKSGSHVDIGADESDGAIHSFVSTIHYVRADGDDANDGLSWATAKKTIQAAIDDAALTLGEVWVKAGEYTENITLASYVSVYGGFAGAETLFAEREPQKNVTSLNPDMYSVEVFRQYPVYIGMGCGLARLNGFLLNNGFVYGYFANVVFANNIFKCDTSLNNPVVRCSKSRINLSNNLFYCTPSGDIKTNPLYIYEAQLKAYNNTFAYTQTSYFSNIVAGSEAKNNVINPNTWQMSNSPDFLVTSNLYHYPGQPLALRQLDGNFTGDAKFADAANGDYRLLIGSHCIAKGVIDSDIGSNADLDNQILPANGVIDIGAYQSGLKSLSIMKPAPLDGIVKISTAVVTAVFPDCYYI